MRVMLIIGTLIGALFALVALLAQVPPDVALPNLQAWATYVGVEELPTWVGTSGADKIATVVGVAGAVISFVFVAVAYKYRQRRTRKEVPNPNPTALSAWTEEESKRQAEARAKVDGYERLLHDGRTLLKQRVTSSAAYQEWRTEYLAWLKNAEAFVLQYEGHRAAGTFSRGLSLWVRLALEDSFNDGHDGERTILSHRLDDLTRYLEWAKDDPNWEQGKEDSGNQYMSLIDAARRARSETLSSDAADFAEQFGKTEDGILRYYALLLVSRCRIPLRGRRPASDTDEPITYDAGLMSIEVKDGKVWIKNRQKGQKLTGLMVKRADLPSAIDDIQKWPGKPVPSDL